TSPRAPALRASPPPPWLPPRTLWIGRPLALRLALSPAPARPHFAAQSSRARWRRWRRQPLPRRPRPAPPTPSARQSSGASSPHPARVAALGEHASLRSRPDAPPEIAHSAQSELGK